MKDRYLPYRIAQVISQALPRPFAYWLGLRIADEFCRRDHAGRAAVMSNIGHILACQGVQASEERLQKMARQTFRYFGKYLVDFFQLSHFDLTQVKRLVNMQNVEYFQQAARHEKGVILATAHIGNWELGGAVVTALGYRLNAVFQPQRLNKVNELFQKHRSERGMSMIPRGKAARGVITALKNREFVAMLADRDFSESTETLPFFGIPARLPSGPARIAVKTGAILIPGFLLRQPDDTFLMKAHEPINPAGLTVDEIRFRIRDILEKEIAQNPCQWFIFDDFWHLRKKL